MAHGDINTESYNPMPQEIANHKLCKEIARACEDRGLQCSKDVKQGTTNKYGSYLTIEQLEGYMAKVNEYPIVN